MHTYAQTLWPAEWIDPEGFESLGSNSCPNCWLYKRVWKGPNTTQTSNMIILEEATLGQWALVPRGEAIP